MDDLLHGSHAEKLTAIQGAEPGEHLCSFPADDVERRRLAAAFIESGLAVGDRVIYASDERPDTVLAFLRRIGVDGDAAAAAGQLRLVSFAAQHGARGAFLPGQAATGYRAAAAAARSDGYPGLHVAGDMGWMARRSVPLPALVEWEERCTAMWAEVGAVGLCQYDTRLFAPRGLSKKARDVMRLANSSLLFVLGRVNSAAIDAPCVLEELGSRTPDASRPRSLKGP